MQYSKYYGLWLPEGTDFFSKDHANHNMEAVDELLKKHEDSINAVHDNYATDIMPIYMSGAGWYRIATIKAPGAYGAIYNIELGRRWTPLPEVLDITLKKASHPSEFSVMVNSREGNAYTSKIRVLYSNTDPDNGACHIDIYSNDNYKADSVIEKMYFKIKSQFLENQGSYGARRAELMVPAVSASGEFAEIPEGYTALEFEITRDEIQANSAKVNDLTAEKIQCTGNLTAENFKGISKNFTTEEWDMAAAAPLVKQLYEENRTLKENVKNIGKVSLKGRNGSGKIALSSNIGTIAIIYVARYGATGEILDTNIFMAYKTYRDWSISDIFTNGGVTCSFEHDTIKIDFNPASPYGDIKILELG